MDKRLKHPTETAEYWLSWARSERSAAATERKSRYGTVESIHTHIANALAYEAKAEAILAAEEDEHLLALADMDATYAAHSYAAEMPWEE